jgi:hypothetical protein
MNHKLLKNNMLRMRVANRGKQHFERRPHVEVLALRCFSGALPARFCSGTKDATGNNVRPARALNRMTLRRKLHREDVVAQAWRDSLELPHHRGDSMRVSRLLHRQMNRSDGPST